MRRSVRTYVRWICVLGLCFGFSTSDAWERADNAGITLLFDATDRGLAHSLATDLVSGRSEVARKFGDGFKTPVTVYLATSEAAFRDLTRGRIPHWGTACAFPQEGVIVLRRLSSYSRLQQVARHELAHILLHVLLNETVPVWFHEGVAMWASHEWRLHQSLETTYAALIGGLHSLGAIEDLLSLPASRASLAYTQSLLAVVHLVHLGGPGAVAEMVERVASGLPFPVALRLTTGLDPDRFEESLLEFVNARFSVAALLTVPEALWTYLAIFFLLVFVAVRRRNRARVRQWEEEDTLEGLPQKLKRQIRKALHRGEDGL